MTRTKLRNGIAVHLYAKMLQRMTNIRNIIFVIYKELTCKTLKPYSHKRATFDIINFLRGRVRASFLKMQRESDKIYAVGDRRMMRS